jgi:hypothetical protein
VLKAEAPRDTPLSDDRAVLAIVPSRLVWLLDHVTFCREWIAAEPKDERRAARADIWPIHRGSELALPVSGGLAASPCREAVMNRRKLGESGADEARCPSHASACEMQSEVEQVGPGDQHGVGWRIRRESMPMDSMGHVR